MFHFSSVKTLRLLFRFVLIKEYYYLLMLEPWQKMSLSPPPQQTCKIMERLDVKELEHACSNIIRVLTKQSPLHKESALLSRFLYKYDKKFRNDIGYRNIRKTNSTLKKYLQLNLLKDVENFVAVLPQDDNNYFPTRQMLEYLLSRIMGFAKIMMRLFVCSKQAAIFYFDRIKRGESHWMSLMPYALLSRVCYLCTVLVHHSTSWYSCLYSYLNSLQPKGLMFLPSGYELPDNLDQWLDLKNLENLGKFNWSHKKKNLDFSLMDEEISTLDNILGFISKINEDIEEIPNETPYNSNDTLLSTNVAKPDCGEVVLRQNMLGVKMDHGKTTSQDSVSVTEMDFGISISRDNKEMDFGISMSRDNKEMDFGIRMSRDNKEMDCGISMFQEHEKKMDHGESVSSKSISILSNFQKNMTGDKSYHYLGKVTNLKSLSEFIDKEENYRNNQDKKSLTSHLSFMQWQTLKNSMTRVCDNLSKSRKVERKLQRVWKEKCLDYL